ncbi:MAG: PQQ-dependent sugar dehydrogenase [Desmonostoc vinosum HA7617-LM4]|jgi:glucose/arabinose dehydrogenase|nr:PQQ-dependent sugar dehydrogenase [Desmonostoc vinosum HA7617-LM4]
MNNSANQNSNLALNQQLSTVVSSAITPSSSLDTNNSQQIKTFARASSVSEPSLQTAKSSLSSGNGLYAEYFDNKNFTNLKLTRIDSKVDFDWLYGSPDKSIDKDTFSVRWTGLVEAKYSDTYTFYTTSDDGVRLWVNGKQIINRFVDQGATEVKGTIALEAGQKYDIKLEYYDNFVRAMSRLSWSSSLQVKEVIPQSQLYTDATSLTATAKTTTLTARNTNTYNFTVTYKDDTAVKVSTLDNSDVLVTGPNEFSQLAKLVSVDNSSNGNERTATYSINAPSGSWNSTKNGTYTINLQANQISDTSGNFAPAANLGTFLVNIAGTGKGLKAEYFDNLDFTNLKLTRTDSTINFDWADGSPTASIANQTFSVRWTGFIEPKYSETYTFYLISDDGAKVSINGEQIINLPTNQVSKRGSGNITLQAGEKYEIKMEYLEIYGPAVAKLLWSSSSQVKEIIPKSQLYTPSFQPIITLGQSYTTVGESDDSLNITVKRNGDDLNSTSTVKYYTMGESAKAGDDYQEKAGTLTFNPGEASKDIIVPILKDSLSESDETFTIVIDQPENAFLGIQRTLRMTIEDDDRTDLSFSEVVLNEDDGLATLKVTRGKSSEAASVKYTTTDGTAKVGTDYQAVSGTLNFDPGIRSQIISIPITKDTIGETNESFNVKFTNPVGVGLNLQNLATISIIDDDPGNLTLETVVSGLNLPTSFEWTPDGDRLYIAEKGGVVRVFEDGKLLAKPFIDISGQVNSVSDRGLLDLAVHPDFPDNPYIYLLFTYDPPEVYNNTNPNTVLDGPDAKGNRAARLIRVTADSATNYTTVVPGSEVVLLGKNSIWENISRPDGNSTDIKLDNKLNYAPSGIINSQTGKRFANMQDYLDNLDKVVNIEDYLATDSESHSVGTVSFGTDGSLFVSLGDGTSYNRVDARAIRVQDLNNLSGKILRIDAMTGKGLSDNPFYDGNSDSNRSRVYNYGLRNPFRFTIDPRTNTPYIGDVGWKTWEEANTGRGANFGWPYYEGADGFNLQQPEYSTLPSAQASYTSGEIITAPIYAYKHVGANAIVVGDFYLGNSLPSIYQGALFIGDPSKGTIDSLTLSDDGKVTSVKRFASGLNSPVQINAGPDGYIYYVSLYGNKIERWRPA